MEFPTSLFLITLLGSGFTIYLAYRLFKGYKFIRIDEQRYHGILTTPERLIEKVHTTATEPLPVHEKARPLVDATADFDLIYLGSVTNEYALQHEVPPTRVYIDENRVILFTIEQVGDLFVSAMSTYFEDGFWVQTLYPYPVCMHDKDYEINGLKTSPEQAYAFHEDTLNRHVDDHGQPKLVTHLESSLDLMNEQILKDHPRTLQVSLKQVKRMWWAQIAVVICFVLMLSSSWQAILFDQVLYSPYIFVLPLILSFLAFLWSRSSIFTTPEIQKKKKHGGSHPFDEA